MATQKTDFLKFNAYGMKDLITRKMSEDSKFTDQIYEGSNLAILIDLVSYMYQCLVYQLNNAASESMFSDTQIYENISRLVKMIGYNPRGCTPAKFDVYVDMTDVQVVDGYNRNSDLLYILPYSYIDTGLMDSEGNPIYFSTYRTNPVDHEPITIESEDYHEVSLVNGKWKLYPTIFTASGIQNEVFTLDLNSFNTDSKKYIPTDYIDVYIKRKQTGEFVSFYQDKEELLMGVSQRNIQDDIGGASQRFSIYSNDDSIYSIRLNENKNYEIKFGDGITCQKLNKGDQLYIFYLDTNGLDGEITIDDIPDFSNLKFVHNAPEFGLKSEDYNGIFSYVETNKYITDINDYSLLKKSTTTTKAKPEEDVEDIKINAPNWFKTGNRLLTRFDYEQFVKQNINSVIDVKCMNNWEYLTTFHKWLYECGIKYHQDSNNPGRYYFEESKFHVNNFSVVDAADANNIYIWVKLDDDSIPQEYIKNQLVSMGMNNLKSLTTEVQTLKPIPVIFNICAGYEDIARIFAKNNDFQTFVQLATEHSYIEVTVGDNSIHVNSFITEQIRRIIAKYFSQQNLKIGQIINTTEMMNEIYSINGVSRVRTVFNPGSVFYDYIDQNINSPRAIDGLSFISYSNGFIDYGEDVSIGNSIRHVEDFQFPVFDSNAINGIVDKIKIIKKQMTNINSIKF